MEKKTGAIFIFVLVIALAVFGCGGGGGGGGGATQDPIDDGVPDQNDEAPAISGFDFTVQEGTFWEYQWDYSSTYVASGSSNSSEYAGRFRITLGSPIDVGGLTFYEMILSGTAIADDHKDFTPRGKYLAVSDNRIITLDADMTTQTVIFDAQTGIWPGSGFFASFPSSTLFEATLSAIDNSYIHTTAYQVRESASESNCEYFPGIGTICGGDYDENMDEQEYYIEGVGPVGLYAYFSMSDWSSPDGGWSASNTSNIGLTASSLLGGTVNYLLEVEPNNQAAEAMPITFPATIRGDSTSETALGGTTPFQVNLTTAAESEPNDSPSAPQAAAPPVRITGNVMVGDLNTSVTVQAAPGGTSYTATFEDWYEVTLGSGKTLTVDLNFPGTAADLDMYLFTVDGSGATIYDNSVDDNLQSGILSEQMSRYLSADTYYVAVDAYDTPARISYTLDITTGDSTVDICDWFRFSLASRAQVTIVVTGGATFVLTDQAMNRTLASGGAQGASVSLDAGNYLIGISQDGEYMLEVTSP